MKHRVALVVALVAVAFAAVPRADILEQILVKVNGDIITKTELEQRQVLTLRQRQPNLRPANDAELAKALAEITPQVVVDAVDELLLVQRGRELGYVLGNEQFESILENIKKENGIESEEQFQAALKQEGLTLGDLRRSLERQMLVSRVQQVEVMARISVTEDEIRAFYEKNRDAFTTKPEITLREMLIAVPVTDRGVNVAQDDAAKARAEDLRARVVAGEPFARLAAENSDAGSKANGGLIGPLSFDVLSPTLQEALKGLNVGDVTPVLRGERGYQFLKVESLTGGETKSLEEARDEIADRVAGTKRVGELGRYLAKLREQAIIEWKNDEVRRAYELGLKQQAQTER
ncbi:MAG: peptidyl-prolyl cis-trans isomerase [Acidobacteriota bacterium]